MTTSRDYAWSDDQPCPPWCVTGGGHLQHRLLHRTDDFWHEGPEVIVATQYSDHNCIPLQMHVRLDQREQVDERGHFRHPVRVDCQNYSLSPDQARKLAAVLLQMAGQAEKATD
jgi:hypothetical protein